MWKYVSLVLAILLVIFVIYSYSEPTPKPVEKFTIAGVTLDVDSAILANSVVDSVKSAKDGATTFSNTLQRRMGMGSAGAGAESLTVDTRDDPMRRESLSSKGCVGTFDCENLTSARCGGNISCEGLSNPGRDNAYNSMWAGDYS